MAYPQHKTKTKTTWHMRAAQILLVASLGGLQGCSAIVATADAAVTVVAETISITAKAVGSVANAIIP